MLRSVWLMDLSIWLGKIAGAMVCIGLTIGANLVGGFESFLSNNSERIKGWLIRTLDATAEVQALGDFLWRLRMFSVYFFFSNSTGYNRPRYSDIRGFVYGSYRTGG